MNNLPITSFLEILDEIYFGSAKDATWVINRKPDMGILDAIGSLNASQASTPLVAGGATIAAHTEHLRWSLQFALTYLQGKTPDSDWSKSWTVKEVDEVGWKRLQQELKTIYETIRTTINQTPDSTNSFFLTGVLAILPHAAYHLGAIKQMRLAVLKRPE